MTGWIALLVAVGAALVFGAVWRSRQGRVRTRGKSAGGADVAPDVVNELPDGLRERLGDLDGSAVTLLQLSTTFCAPCRHTRILLRDLAERTDGATLDDFDELCDYLAGLHASKYGRLVDGVAAVHLRGVHAAPDQDVALRLVALADRLYDRAIPVRASGEPLSALFTEDMLQGGYRKKYLRAVSRLTALSRDLAKS